MEPQFSTKTITSTSSKLYTVNATYKPLHPDALPEEGSLDLILSDGVSAWSAQDIIDQDLAHQIPNRMKHALEALTDLLEPKEDYIFKIEEDSRSLNKLTLNVEWSNSKHGKDVVLRLHIVLQNNDGIVNGRRVAPFNALSQALDELNKATSECENLQNGGIELEKNVERQLATLDAYADKKQRRDESIAIKTAALLSSKSKKIQELLSQQ